MNSVNSSQFEPAYLALLRSGELQSRVEQAYRHLEDCDLCARYCHINRLKTIKGAICRTGERAVVHSYGPHHARNYPCVDRRVPGPFFQLVQPALCLLPKLGVQPEGTGG